MLTVVECLPFADRTKHVDRIVRVAYLDRPNDALSVPWVKSLPGEKRIRFFHGQVFVLQHYLGITIARAQIHPMDRDNMPTHPSALDTH
jgi:hypothetical protein